MISKMALLCSKILYILVVAPKSRQTFVSNRVKSAYKRR